MSSELDVLISLGHDITSFKYYAFATGTILFYDYLLTLGDEIKYVWCGQRSWVFWLFLINRYFPMTYHFWQFATSYYDPRSELIMRICDKTSFYHIFMATVCTLVAQVVLTLRAYAVTLKNLPITFGFATITAVQLMLGICMTSLAASRGVQRFPPIPYDAFHMCIFVRQRTLDIAFTSISLLYDTLAFWLIIFSKKRSEVGGLKIRTVLGTVAEDATWYFLVICASHFTLEMTLGFGRESIQLLPATGTVSYIPVMISRIVLSLRKAADTDQDGWSLGGTSGNVVCSRNISFFHRQTGDDWREDGVTSLDTLESEW